MTRNLPRRTCANCGHRDAIKMGRVDETPRLWWLCGPCDTFTVEEPQPDPRFVRTPPRKRRGDAAETVAIVRAVEVRQPATMDSAIGHRGAA